MKIIVIVTARQMPEKNMMLPVPGRRKQSRRGSVPEAILPLQNSLQLM
jgi:hypothetical protein